MLFPLFPLARKREVPVGDWLGGSRYVVQPYHCRFLAKDLCVYPLQTNQKHSRIKRGLYLEMGYEGGEGRTRTCATPCGGRLPNGAYSRCIAAFLAVLTVFAPLVTYLRWMGLCGLQFLRGSM